jgi:hypothetical protein
VINVVVKSVPHWTLHAHLEVLRDLTDETLEGQLADEELSRLLVATDLAEGDRSGTEAMGLLHTTSGGLQDGSCQVDAR